jgi:hypothetical protein
MAPHNSMCRISSAITAAATGAAVITSKIRQSRNVRAQLSSAESTISHRLSP